MALENYSATVMRPIANVNEGMLIGLQEMFRSHESELSSGLRKSVGFSRQPNCVLLGPEELDRFHQEQHIPFDEAKRDDLVIFLEDELPEEMDSTLWVPTLPLLIASRGKRKSTLHFGLEVEVGRERRTVLQAIHDFHEITEPVEELWPIREEALLQVAMSAHSQRVTALEELADIFKRNPEDFPVTMEGEGIMINPVDPEPTN